MAIQIRKEVFLIIIFITPLIDRQRNRSLCNSSYQSRWHDDITPSPTTVLCFLLELLLLQLNSFRSSVVSLLGMDTTCPDYEIIGRLTKVMNAYKEFSSVSRRYDEPVLPHVHISTPYHSPRRAARSPRFSPDHKTPRCDDSGFLDPIIDDCDSDLNSIYNKPPYRAS